MSECHQNYYQIIMVANVLKIMSLVSLSFLAIIIYYSSTNPLPLTIKQDTKEILKSVIVDNRKSVLKDQLIKSEEGYQKYVQKRNEKVPSDPSKIKPWTSNHVLYYWDYLLPSFSCPHTIERIGGLGDGGKWICGMDLYEAKYPDKEPREPCIVYSIGVAIESSFEAEILERTNCSIYAYDASVTKMGPQVQVDHPRVHFKQLYIGSSNTIGTRTLKTLMNQNDHKFIDILKMDVEGGEVEVLNEIMNDFEILPFGQMQIEFHTNEKGSNFPSVYKLWELMEERGLRAFKNEVNQVACVLQKRKPLYVEYSFINTRGNHRLIH